MGSRELAPLFFRAEHIEYVYSDGNVPSEGKQVKLNNAERRVEDNHGRKCPGAVGAAADQDEELRNLVYTQIYYCS